MGSGSCLNGILGLPSSRINSTRRLSSGSPGSRVMPSPCWPPLASWANVVMTYLLSDLRGLWQAMQFSTKIGATSRMKLTGWITAFGSGLTSGFAADDPALFGFGGNNGFFSCRGGLGCFCILLVFGLAIITRCKCTEARFQGHKRQDTETKTPEHDAGYSVAWPVPQPLGLSPTPFYFTGPTLTARGTGLTE